MSYVYSSHCPHSRDGDILTIERETWRRPLAGDEWEFVERELIVRGSIHDPQMRIVAQAKHVEFDPAWWEPR